MTYWSLQEYYSASTDCNLAADLTDYVTECLAVIVDKEDHHKYDHENKFISVMNLLYSYVAVLLQIKCAELT